MSERDTEDRILDAAHAVFLRRGTAGARMQEVADEAGVNKALLHYYFRSKDQLGQAVFQRALQALLPRALAVLESDAPLEEKVRRIVALEVDILRENPFLPGYLLGELTHQPGRVQGMFETAVGVKLESLGERVQSKLGEQLEAEAAAGRMRPMEPADFLVNLVSLVIFPFAASPLLRGVLSLGEAEYLERMERRKDTLPEFFLNALRP